MAKASQPVKGATQRHTAAKCPPAAVGGQGDNSTRRVFEVICERIRSQLLSGELRLGNRLPPGRELSEIDAVSRTAVHEALIIMEMIGLPKLKRDRKGGAYTSEHGTGLFARSFGDMLGFKHAGLEMLLEARDRPRVGPIGGCTNRIQRNVIGKTMGLQNGPGFDLNGGHSC